MVNSRFFLFSKPEFDNGPNRFQNKWQVKYVELSDQMWVRCGQKKNQMFQIVNVTISRWNNSYKLYDINDIIHSLRGYLDFGDGCWWRMLEAKCVGDKFGKSRQHNDSAANIWNQSPTSLSPHQSTSMLMTESVRWMLETNCVDDTF